MVVNLVAVNLRIAASLARRLPRFGNHEELEASKVKDLHIPGSRLQKSNQSLSAIALSSMDRTWQ